MNLVYPLTHQGGNGEKCDQNILFGHPKLFSGIQNSRFRPFCEKKLHIDKWFSGTHVADLFDEIAKNAHKRDFRASKVASSHFVILFYKDKVAYFEHTICLH